MNNEEYNTACSATYQWISDCSKDAMGVRYRFNFREYTLVQLEMMGDSWCQSAEAAVIDENRYTAECEAEFEATVINTIAMGAGDRKTALRWLFDAEGLDMGADVGFFGHLNNLGYSYDIFQGVAA